MDAVQFKRASHDVWEAMAAGWDKRHAYFEEMARPVTDRMIERLDPSEGQTVLDLAAGTGVVGFSAAPLVGPDGQVIVSDFAEAMVDAARRHAARLGLENVECRVLDAERLDLPDDHVEGVLCRWGYMLMPDPAVAVRETRRVLRPGGRAAAAVFAGPQENQWAALPGRVLQQQGHVPPPEPGTPGILALADRDRLAGLFTGAGFADPAIEDVQFTLRFEGLDDYWTFLTEVAGAIAMVLARLGPDEQQRVRAGLAELSGPFARGEALEFPATSLVVSAS